MSVFTIPTTNINLLSDIRDASAAAVYHETSPNISLSNIKLRYFNPRQTSNYNMNAPASYRKLIVTASNTGGDGTVSVTYPSTSPIAYTSASGTTSITSVATTDSIRTMYLVAFSYSSYTFVRLTASPTYPDNFKGWYSNSGGVGTAISTTTSLNLFSGTQTSTGTIYGVFN